jgi:uncharacterized protein with GYD domain
MPTFITFINWTDQGIRNIKEAPHRAEAAKALLRDMGGEVKEMYLTSGDNDAMLIAEVPDGDTMAKFALAVASQGNVRTRTIRGWTESEFQKIVADLP